MTDPDPDSLDDVPDVQLLALLVAGQSAILQRLKELQDRNDSDKSDE